MNRTTKKVFKYIYKRHTLSLNHLYSIFPNEYAIEESYQILINDDLIINRDNFVMLTVKGYDYYYNLRKNAIFKVFKILISPIVVGVVTAIITAKLVSLPNNCNCNVTCNTRDNDFQHQD